MVRGRDGLVLAAVDRCITESVNCSEIPESLHVCETAQPTACCHLPSPLPPPPITKTCICVLTTRHNDDDQQDDDAHDDAHAHLHVLPPHLLAHAVGAPAETVGLRRQVVRLVLQVIEPLAALRDLVDVVLHRLHGAVDFLEINTR